MTAAPSSAARLRVDESPPASLPAFDDDACDLTRPRLAVAPDGSGFLAISQGFVLSRYDADGCRVEDLVLGIVTGYARDIVWSPAGDRFAYAIDSPSRAPGCIELTVSLFEGATIAEHCFPLRSGRVVLAWSPDGSRLAMLNGTLLVVTDGEGELIAQLGVDGPGGRPKWTDDGETLLVPSGDPVYDYRFSRDGERQPRSPLGPLGPPLTWAPDGSGFLAVRNGFILALYDAAGEWVDDLALGMDAGIAFDVAWSPAGDRYAYAVVSPPKIRGLTSLSVSYFEFRTRAPGEVGRDPYRAISGHGFPVAGDEVSLVWSPDGSRLAMLNGTLLIVADEDGDVVARIEVEATGGPPRWTADGETLILPPGGSTAEQRFTRDGAVVN